MALAFDTETHLMANGQMAPRIVCLQYDDGSVREILVGESIRRFAHAMLEKAKCGTVVVGQNTAYDMSVLAAYDETLLGPIFAAYDAGAVQCTRLRERLLDIAKGQTGPQTRQRGYYSMDALVERRKLPVAVNKQNPWRLKYAELENVPLEEWPGEAIDYAITDPTATRLIYESQTKEAVAIEYKAFEAEAARQAGFDFAFRLMSCWGVRTSRERVEALMKKTVASLGELHSYLVENGILTPQGSKNMAAIRERIVRSFANEGKSAPTTKTGLVATDADTIEMCRDKVLEAVVEHSHLTKLKNTYITKLMEGTTANIHAEFHTLGADTGRTSSSNPNLQNQSKKGGVRECFVPRPGFVFVGADYDAQELRTLAQACLDICKYSNLAKKFREDPDFDPHTAFAANVMGWTYAEAMERKKKGDKEVKERRQQAKAANFGFPGGLGAKNFRIYAKGYGVDLSEEQAQELRKHWFEQWPEMTDYFKNIKWMSDGGKAVQLRSGRIRGHIGFCDGANTMFQGLASEASKTACYLVVKACYSQPNSPLYGCRLLMLVHDELILEAPESYAHEAALELQRLMVKAMEMWCPDVPARATPVISRCWSKDAERIVENGRLVPWDVPAEEGENI